MPRTAPTTVRRTTVTLPAAAVGPDNPLPALLPLDEAHTVDRGRLAAFPPDMARQLRYPPPRTMLPTRLRDGYGRERTPTDIEALVVENDRLRATVLPGLGGRVHSLHHKPTGRELLYRNPVLQPANFALNGAWFSGGIEWNIGATGHTTLSCAPLHAARVPAPDGSGDMLRLWEWERLRETPFQVDLWLPAGSDFLLVGVRVRNPHIRSVPVYWWSNTAVPEDERTRVLAPAEECWHFAYDRRLRRVPVPEWEGVDRSYPLRDEFPADYFYEVPEASRKWIASLDADGRGLVQTSTDLLRGRKLFVWGHGSGGRRWQRWLTEPGTPGYAEIQAGLARTQLEHVRLRAGQEHAWLEAYGPLEADPAAVHGPDWAAARAEAETRLESVLPRADVAAAFAAWLPHADTDPEGEWLATGSGWGALEVLRGGYAVPGTPFPERLLGEEQRPWLELLSTGSFPEDPGPRARSNGGAAGRRAAAARLSVPAPSLVSDVWRDLLECAPAGPLTDYHLGVAQWHAGDLAQAVRSWERSEEAGPTPWARRCLALADAHDQGSGAHRQRAADRYRSAVDQLAEAVAAAAPKPPDPPAGEDPPAPAAAPEPRPGAPATLAVALAALVREAVPVLLAAGRPGDAQAALDLLPAWERERGRTRLLAARVHAAAGDPAAAREVFERGFEVADLREGDDAVAETWRALTGEPVPARYDFRMRPR